MKSRSILLLSSLCLLVFCFSAPGVDVDKEKVLKKVRQVLTYMHFSPKKIDNEFSKQVYDRYIESLDPYKRNFTQEDITRLEKYKNSLDEFYLNDDLTFYNLSYELYYNSIEENEKMTEEVLKEPLNFDEEEYLILDTEKLPFPKNKKEKKDIWRKYIKYLILDKVQTLNDTVTDLKADSTKIQTPSSPRLTKDELIKKATEKVSENLKEKFRSLKSQNKEDLFDYYVNAFAEDYDPHTTYFSPKGKDFFDQSISGTFQGIGATLMDDKGYATIKDLVVGGPAWKSKKVNKEDKILEVAEEGKDPVNIVGMDLDDAILLIRGKKGTKVILTLKRENGNIEKVTLERDIIEIEESFVKSSLLIDEKGNKHGYIYIPSFYINVNDRNGRNVSDDIKKELLELKKDDIKSIILDVRNNGGGSLNEVVEIVGLFIDNGPVVQVRSSNNDEKVYYDTDEGLVWDGALAVMTNEFSASASEILAGAIQDYQRGIIIGSEKTYGKGTVQQVIPLDRFSENSELGDLKLTTQKFYRITGASTQRKGVTSDIILSDKYKYSEISESNEPNALPWDEIKPLNFKKWQNKYNLSKLKAQSEARINQTEYIKNANEEAEWIKMVKDESKFSLQYATFFKNLNERKEKLKYFDKREIFTPTFKAEYPKYEKTLIQSDTLLKNKRDDWHSNIKKDFYIQETINILKDAM